MTSLINLDAALSAEIKKPLVIYHGNCADGFSAAWVFYHMQDKIEQGFDFHAGIYGEIPPDCSDRIVYLVDFSYKKAIVLEICKVAKKVILIDHHKTAIEDLKDLQDISSPLYQKNFDWYVDIERSGAMLAWDYWNNHVGELTYTPGNSSYEQPPMLLDYVQDRDLWKFKLPGSREVSASVFSNKYSFEKWDELMLNKSIVSMEAEGHAIERKHHKDIEELLNVCQHMATIGGHSVPGANLPYTLASDACHKMAAAYKDGTMFAATYYDTGTDRIYSLRSCHNGMDVSQIAAFYGGGGHRNAAGFKIPLIRMEVISQDPPGLYQGILLDKIADLPDEELNTDISSLFVKGNKDGK